MNLWFEQILPYLVLVIFHLNSGQVDNQVAAPSRDQPAKLPQALYCPPGAPFEPVHFTEYLLWGSCPPVPKCVLDCSQGPAGSGCHSLGLKWAFIHSQKEDPLRNLLVYGPGGQGNNMDLSILGVLQQYLGLLVLGLGLLHLSLRRLLLRLGLLLLKLGLRLLGIRLLCCA
ncbi:hypothetical protein DSO57_1033292 [Entomophthora muscae]|uniref:Uncharacterized protein n=1 Tax=Entomophthora muscae TaxID=34485 RepID=A0ACC2S214_9FUNG|nr:hypothetical protein DSO57_1033292 [Entomophthora muscae]